MHNHIFDNQKRINEQILKSYQTQTLEDLLKPKEEEIVKSEEVAEEAKTEEVKEEEK